MKFTNISNKVIGIGGVNVMPDGSAVITEEVSKLPAVQAYIRLGMAALSPDDGKAAGGSGGTERKDGGAEGDAKAETESADKKKAKGSAGKPAAAQTAEGTGTP